MIFNLICRDLMLEMTMTVMLHAIVKLNKSSDSHDDSHINQRQDVSVAKPILISL